MKKRIILVFCLILTICFISQPRDKVYLTTKTDSIYLDLETILQVKEITDGYKEEIKAIEEEKRVNTVWSVAYGLVGYYGNCYYIANLFSIRYRGKSLAYCYKVWIPYNQAEPGDLVYYYNGGIGYQHWATYLGNGYALQGNYNGIAIITSVWLRNATAPNFYRVY